MIDFTNEVCFRFFAEIVQLLKSTNQHEQVLHIIVDRLVRLLKCQTCAVVLIDPKTEYLHIDNCHGLSLTFCNAFRRRIATASIGQLLWTGKPVVIDDAGDIPVLAAELRLEKPFASCAAVQIEVDHRTLGYLYVDSTERHAFREPDLKVLQVFADIAGLALHKSHMFEENLRLERVDRETGVEKYVPFLEKLTEGMARAREFHETFSLLLLDIDNFKDTTHTFGYEASRQLLKEMGDIVKASIRPVDAAGRYGFDEFIVLLANTAMEDSLASARKLLTMISQRTFTRHSINSTVSIGVASFPQNGETIEDLVLTAKKALFEAQRAGRNNVFSFPSAWYARETV